MYLYFNKSGELTTKILHGEIPRQGNPLNLYVCFGLDFFEGEITRPNYVISAEFIKPDGTKVGPFNLTYQGEKQFEKLKTSEITYDLISGEFYHTYFDNISGSHFNIPGDYKAFINVYNNEKKSNGYTEKVDFFVERTIGYNQEDITIDLEQFDILQKENKDIYAKIQILEGNKLEKVEESKIVYGTDSEGNQTTIPYSVGSTVKGNAIVVRDEENRINVNDPVNDTHAVNKRFADNTYVNKDLVSYATINNTIPMRDGNGRINVNSPQENQHAATKGYVDDEIAVLGKIKNIQGSFTEEQITLMWDTLEDGRYTLISNDYGSEIILVNKNTNDYSRITPSGKVFAYDFEEKEWKQVSGGGGGGSGDSALVTLTSISPFTINTAVGSKTAIDLEWTSGNPGNGFVYVYINNELKQTSSYPQGKISVDISKFVTEENTYALKLVVEDANGNKRSAIYTVNVVSLNVTATFSNYDEFIDNKHIIGTGGIRLIYTTVGQNLSKKVFLQIDTNEPIHLGTFEEPSYTGEYVISDLSHKLHTIKLWASTDINSDGEDDLASEIIEYNLLYYVSGDATPILSTTFKNTTIEEGQGLVINYVAYTNGAIYTKVTRTVNGVSEESQDEPKLISWTVPYNVGTNNISLSAGSTKLDFVVVVNKSSVQLAPAANPVLFLSSTTKNNQVNKNVWEYRDNINNKTYSTSFTDFLWGERDGWLKDEDNLTALHLSGSARAVIDYQPLATMPNTGKTIEIEFATKNVINYTEKIIDIKGNNKRGITVYPNQFMLETNNYNNSNAIIEDDDTEEEIAAKQNIEAINTKFKEDEHIRISIVITPKEGSSGYNGKSLIYTYVNGIISGITPYNKETETFTQDEPVSITIGSSYCDVLLYKVRVYDRMLSYNEVLNNYMYDTDNYEYKNELINKNFKLVSSNMSYSEMHKLMPIVTITAAKLPTQKADLFTCSVRIHYPDGKDITYTNVKIKVQGTSSLEYAYKNFDLDFSESPNIGDGIQLYDGAIPEKKLTIKADYASSAGVYNAGNAKIVNDLYQEKNPRQEDDARVRNTIYGTPVAVYYRQNSSQTEKFYYKGSLNLSKLSNALGYQEGDESWSTEDNISSLCLFRSNVFGDEEDPEKFIKIAFDARYPKNAPFDNLKNLINWIYSCCTIGDKPENDVLNTEKFKNESSTWFNIYYLKMYYIYFMVMGGIDSMAKNMYLTRFAKDNKWYPQFYDMDTSFGINNQGKLKFNYNIEPGDRLGTPYIFNGSASILWKLVAASYADEIKELYKELRSQDILTYENMLKVLYDDGIKIYPESVYNKDVDIKYIQVYATGDNRLSAALGSTLEHLKFWIKNRIYYLDSLWQAGDYADDRISCRVATPPEGVTHDYTIDLTTYRDMYAYIHYGTATSEDSGYKTIQKAYKGVPCTMVPPFTEPLNNTEVNIYGASSLTNLGDLSKWYCEDIDLGEAEKLSVIKIGAESPYSNPNLTSVTIGSNKLLREMDVRNCPALSSSIDTSNCPNLETFLAEGTILSSVSFANGGELKTVHLPDTITSFILRNQNKITDLQFVGNNGYNNIEKLRVEYSNVPNLFEMVNNLVNSNKLKRLRLVGINWTIDSVSILDKIMENVKGINSNGDDQDKSVLIGKIKINTQIEAGRLQEYRDYWGSGLIFEVDSANLLPVYLCKFYNYNKTIVEKQYVNNGEYATSPINPDLIVKPQNDAKEVYYVFKTWVPDVSTTRITENLVFTPEFEEHNLLIVQWKNYDGTTIKIDKVISGAVVSYPLDEPVPYRGPDQEFLTYDFAKWTDQNGNEKALYEEITVTSNLTLTANFVGSQKQQYTVKWYNKDILLETDTVEYGGIAEYNGTTPVHEDGYTFVGWGVEDFIILGNTNFYAQFNEPTRFKIQVDDTTKIPRINVRGVSDTYDLVINWGDGTSDTYTLTKDKITACQKSSVYSTNGEYTIILPPSTDFEFKGNASYSSTAIFNNLKILEAVIVKTSISNADFMFWMQDALTSIQLLNETKIIPYKFLQDSSISQLTIPDTVETINEYAFSGCKNLENVIIPKNVKTISGDIFANCSKLTKIEVVEDNQYYCTVEDVLYSKDKKTLIQYPVGKTDESYVMLDTVTQIQGGAFGGATNLKNITFSKSLIAIRKSVGVAQSTVEGPFAHCENLENVYYNNTIENWIKVDLTSMQIGSSTIIVNPMYYAKNFYVLNGNNEYYEPVEVVVPENTTSINNSCFMNFSKLQRIVLPEAITRIGSNSFRGCSNLKEINIPGAITAIGDYAFYNCSSLSSIITIPETVSKLNNYDIFYNCSSLKKVNIHVNDLLLYGSFEGCSSLEQVNIYSHSVNFNAETFMNCVNLESIVFHNSITSLACGFWVFKNNNKLSIIDFSNNTTIPSLSKITGFDDVPSTCKFILPDALYDEWVVATNWNSLNVVYKKKSEVSE